MIRLTTKVIIGAYAFEGVTNIEIESSWENLTDTCKITIPRRLSWAEKDITQIIKRGDKIKVYIGYGGVNNLVFQGFIRDFDTQIPIVVTCEDAMFLLKKGNQNRSYKTVNTEQLIKDMVGSIMPFEVVANAGLGNYKVKNATAAKVLEHLRSHYFIKSFCRAGKLYVGLAYIAKLQRVHNFYFNTESIIDHSLQFKLKDDVRLSLKGIIMYADNKKKEVPVGDDDGEQRTFHYYNRPESEVKKSLEAHLERLKYTGYYGSFVAFGLPQVNHGDIVNLKDDKYFERNGKYLVKKVSSTFGFGGYRQTIELEAKA